MSTPFRMTASVLEDVEDHIEDVRFNDGNIVSVTFTKKAWETPGICEYLCGLGDVLYRVYGIHYAFDANP